MGANNTQQEETDRMKLEKRLSHIGPMKRILRPVEQEPHQEEQAPNPNALAHGIPMKLLFCPLGRDETGNKTAVGVGPIPNNSVVKVLHRTNPRTARIPANVGIQQQQSVDEPIKPITRPILPGQKIQTGGLKAGLMPNVTRKLTDGPIVLPENPRKIIPYVAISPTCRGGRENPRKTCAIWSKNLFYFRISLFAI
jgi:hypothetical protein